ncbi:mfs transporter [Moniliophthora roreri MCA 2997]|uniref:Mfs transporter n=1 Tax=Moniliophthora roreri (strain MCA 2997) TaxID=1381753 RepID=V2WUE6_MONRO|nr:mfs transporter [Moniliophthora roreri MCA 2997]
MPSLSVAVPPPVAILPPNLHRDADITINENHENTEAVASDESAVDMEPIEMPPLNTARGKGKIQAHASSSVESFPERRGSEAAYELHPIPTYLSERTRRPSAIRHDSVPETILSTKTAEEDITASVARESALPVLDFPEDAAQSRAMGQLTKKQKTRAILHLAALYWTFFLEGWNDGSVGPLLPVIQRDYRVGFEVVALLFVTNCVGFITGAFLNVYATHKLGFGKVMVLGSIFQLIAYIIQSPAPPFPVLVMSFFFAGLGLSFQNAQGNGFVGSLQKNQSMKLMVLHASYGLGAFCSPLVATYFSGVRHWSFHYLISAGIAVSNTAVLIAVFRFRTQDELMQEIGQSSDEQNAGRTDNSNLYRQIFNNKALHFMAIFALIYIGVEVTVGGWIVTFIIEERDGGHSAGYISSGFFGGLTIGRLALWWINKKVGEYTVIFFYTILAIALEVTVWLVPSIIQNAIAVSFIGVLLGPMFPLMVTHGSRVIPASIFTGSMGWITGIGMSGSAALPFITGVLAAKYGIGSLQPFLIAMMSTMVGLWAMVPKRRRVD